MTEQANEPIDAEYAPNYKRRCQNCEQTPTVDVLNAKTKKLEWHSDLCGPCCFGEAACLDPENW